MSMECDVNQINNAAMRIEARIADKELEKVSQLIYQRAGIVLSSQKRDMVYNRLSRRLRELKLTHFSEYLSRLESNPNSSEWQAFVNALTTNLTSFFREALSLPCACRARARTEGKWKL